MYYMVVMTGIMSLLVRHANLHELLFKYGHKTGHEMTMMN